MSIFDDRDRFFTLKTPTNLNSIEDILGSHSKYFTYKKTLRELMKEFTVDDVTEEIIDGVTDINSSFCDWAPLTEIVNHEFMCFYYTALIVNVNPDSPDYKYVALMSIKEGNGYEFIKLFDNIDSFLEDFKNFENNKPLLNDEYLKKVEEYKQIYDSKLWLHWIRSSYGNYLLSKHHLHEEEY